MSERVSALLTRTDAFLTRSKVLGACALLTLAYAVFSIHGFSVSRWHLLDDSPETELLIGASQGVRSDDWALWLPSAFAQIQHDPDFPLHNLNMALGQNMALVTSAAIADPIVVFRPPVWGFFVGPDFGMGWCWGVYVFGFVAAFHLLFLEISQGRPLLSLAAAVALLFSPFFQFWSLNAAFLASTVALGVVAAHRLSFATQRWQKWLCGLALGWSAGAFALTLYPPYQVVMGWFGLFTLLGLILRSRQRASSLAWDRDRSLGALAALLVVGFAAGHFFLIAHEAIRLTASTLYPGQRVATGGATSPWLLFSNNVLPHYFVRASSVLGRNLCEAASFVLLFPLALALLVSGRNRRAFAGDPLLLSLVAYLALLFVWNVLGFPEFLARLTLFSKAPEHRTAIGLGVADVALVLALLASPATQPLRLASNARRAAFFAALLAPLLLLVVGLGRAEPQLLGAGAVAQIALLVGAQLAVGFLLATKRPAALVAFAALNVACTAWFNPVVHGGFAAIWNNPVSEKIRALDAAHGGRSSWIVFDDLVVGQLPPMLGARSLASVQFYPQPDFWRALDPEQDMAAAYNRFAHVAFVAHADPGRLTLRSPSSDVCLIEVHPDDPRLLALPFDFVIQAGAPGEALLRSRNYRRIASAGRFHFFERIRN
jgi:hypothetical protein